jgi:hypothetical protein
MAVGTLDTGMAKIDCLDMFHHGISHIKRDFIDHVYVNGKQNKTYSSSFQKKIPQLLKATYAKNHNPFIGMVLLAYEKGDKEHVEKKLRAAGFILQSAQPVLGWPYDIIGGQALQGRKWAEYQAVVVRFSNLILSELYSKLPKGALSDPQIAEEEIAYDYLHMPNKDFEAAAKQAAQDVESGLASGMTVNEANSQNVQFQIGDSTYTGESQGGWSISENGVKWYGDGHLSGRNVTVGLESSINKDVSQQRNIVQKLTNDINNGSESSATAEASE